jgi:hypothetical protein
VVRSRRLPPIPQRFVRPRRAGDVRQRPGRTRRAPRTACHPPAYAQGTDPALTQQRAFRFGPPQPPPVSATRFGARPRHRAQSPSRRGRPRSRAGPLGGPGCWWCRRRDHRDSSARVEGCSQGNPWSRTGLDRVEGSPSTGRLSTVIAVDPSGDGRGACHPFVVVAGWPAEVVYLPARLGIDD